MKTPLVIAAPLAWIALALGLVPVTSRAQTTSLITYFGTVSQVAGPAVVSGRFRVRIDNDVRSQHGAARVGIGQAGVFALTFVSTNNQAAGVGDIVYFSVLDSAQSNVVVAMRTVILGTDAITSGMVRADLLLATGLGVDVIEPGPNTFQPGASTNVTVHVLNTGVVTDSFRLTVLGSNSTWGLQYPHSLASVAPGGTATSQVVVSVPGGAHSGLEYLFVLACSLTNGLVCDFTTVPTAIPSEAAPPAAARLTLEQNHPNPFNPTTEIEFGLPTASAVWLSIFDLRGRRVRTLLYGAEWPAGRHRVPWNGTDDLGRAVVSGVYVYRLGTSAGSLARRMVFAK